MGVERPYQRDAGIAGGGTVGRRREGPSRVCVSVCVCARARVRALVGRAGLDVLTNVTILM